MAEPDYQQRVVVTDVNISFGNLVALIVKSSVAVIPAAIILGFIAIVAGGVLADLVSQ